MGKHNTEHLFEDQMLRWFLQKQIMLMSVGLS